MDLINASDSYFTTLGHYVSKFIPKNIPKNLRVGIHIFYVEETHKNLNSVYDKYGMFILDYSKSGSWTTEITEKYGNHFDENSYFEALSDIVEVFQAPEEWLTYFDQLNQENIVLLYKAFVDDINSKRMVS